MFFVDYIFDQNDFLNNDLGFYWKDFFREKIPACFLAGFSMNHLMYKQTHFYNHKQHHHKTKIKNFRTIYFDTNCIPIC